MFGIDDWLLGTAVTAGANLLGGMLTGNSANQAQADANKANIQLAAENRQFQQEMAIQDRGYNSEQAAMARKFSEQMYGKEMEFNSQEAMKNRLFQVQMQQQQQSYNTTMANSAYQRAMADMQKAGLNPLLAYMQGGADTPNIGLPSGSSASVGSIGSAQASHSGSYNAQARVEPNNAGAEIMARKVWEAVSSSLEAQRLKKEIAMTGSEVDLNKGLKQQALAIAKNNVNNAAKAAAETRFIEKQSTQLGLQSQRLKLEMPGVEERGKFEQSWWNKQQSWPWMFWKKVGDTVGLGMNLK